ncbi:conjugal transfer protein TraH [Amycolatopsis sp. NPDC059090]|uniref:conjugal transfer protein TraH n=1 Tax=unclassified Amycolatopsis TaxID=2618356 RepID=UPI00367357DF
MTVQQEGRRTRTERAVVWIGGHFGEVVAVSVPCAVGGFTTVWLDLVSAAAAAVWAWHELRLRRRTRAGRAALAAAGPAPRQLTGAAAPAGRETGPDGRKEASG